MKLFTNAPERLMWTVIGIAVFLAAQKYLCPLMDDLDNKLLAMFGVAYFLGAVRQQFWVSIVCKWKKPGTD